MDSGRILVGDVGGTHARFATVNTSKQPFGIGAPADLGTEGYANFGEALRAYLERIGTERPPAAAIAVAAAAAHGRGPIPKSGGGEVGKEPRARGLSRAPAV